MFMKETICMIAGVVGGVITTLLGGWDSALATLVVFMGIDFVTGVVTAVMANPSTAAAVLSAVRQAGLGLRRSSAFCSWWWLVSELIFSLAQIISVIPCASASV